MFEGTVSKVLQAAFTKLWLLHVLRKGYVVLLWGKFNVWTCNVDLFSEYIKGKVSCSWTCAHKYPNKSQLVSSWWEIGVVSAQLLCAQLSCSSHLSKGLSDCFMVTLRSRQPCVFSFARCNRKLQNSYSVVFVVRLFVNCYFQGAEWTLYLTYTSVFILSFKSTVISAHIIAKHVDNQINKILS